MTPVQPMDRQIDKTAFPLHDPSTGRTGWTDIWTCTTSYYDQLYRDERTNLTQFCE